MAGSRYDDRFRLLVHRRLEPGETIGATARVWTSRPSRLPRFTARYRDQAVVTDRRLMVWTCGWWTRRPRRRVLADRLDELTIMNATGPTRRSRVSTGIVLRLRVDHSGRRPVVFDVGPDDASQRFARILLTGHAETAATNAATA